MGRDLFNPELQPLLGRPSQAAPLQPRAGSSAAAAPKAGLAPVEAKAEVPDTFA